LTSDTVPTERGILRCDVTWGATWGETCNATCDATWGATGATWATSPPFHVYSRTWDWYPGRGRTPEKLGDVCDVKKEDLYLLSTSSPKSLESSEITARWCPRIWALISTTILSAKKETFSTWCPVQGLVLRSLRRLAMLMQGAVPIWPLGGRYDAQERR
jgi:hypothetical protein